MNEWKLKKLELKRCLITGEWLTFSLVILLMFNFLAIPASLIFADYNDIITYTVLGFTFSMLLLFLIVKYILSTFFNFSSSYRKSLPINLSTSSAWKTIIDALEVGSELELTQDGYVFNALKRDLFKTSAYSKLTTDEDVSNYIVDTENSVLWTAKLTDIGLSSKIAFLINLDTPEKLEAFQKMDEQELKKFTLEFKEFLKYVRKVNRDTPFRESELERRNVLSSLKLKDLEQELVLEDVKVLYSYTQNKFNHREKTSN